MAKIITYSYGSNSFKGSNRLCNSYESMIINCDYFLGYKISRDSYGPFGLRGREGE